MKPPQHLPALWANAFEELTPDQADAVIEASKLSGLSLKEWISQAVIEKTHRESIIRPWIRNDSPPRWLPLATSLVAINLGLGLHHKTASRIHWQQCHQSEWRAE